MKFWYELSLQNLRTEGGRSAALILSQQSWCFKSVVPSLHDKYQTSLTFPSMKYLVFCLPSYSILIQYTFYDNS